MDVTFSESVPMGGTYANGALVWNTPHEFTVDFTSHRSPTHDGDAHDVLVVARMKIPTSAMFRIVQAMSANIDRYERQYGRITPGGFRFTVRTDDDNVSISRPVSPEDVDRVRRQLAEWATRRPAHPA